MRVYMWILCICAKVSLPPGLAVPHIYHARKMLQNCFYKAVNDSIKKELLRQQTLHKVFFGFIIYVVLN